MNLKVTKEKEAQILELVAQGLTRAEIARMVGVSKRSVQKVIAINRVPEEEIKTNKNINVCDLLSMRLLLNCEDIELLTKMFVNSFCFLKPEKILVPERILNVGISPKKINKIVSIAQRAGLNCTLEYEKRAI